MGDLTNLPNFEPAPRVYTHTDLNQVFGELAVKPQAVTTGKLADNAVATAKLADKAVTTAKLQLGSVTADRLAESAVATGKLADASVTTDKLADNSISPAKLQDQSVTVWKIQDGAVNSAKIPNGAVILEKIANGAVSNAKLGEKSVGTSKIDDGAVTTVKIANGAVTAAKLGGDVNLNLADGSVTTAKLANSSVTSAKLASGAVGTAHIQNAAITPEKLGGGAAGHRAVLGLNTDQHVTHAGFTVKAQGQGGADILLWRDSSGVNEHRFWITFHGGTLYFRPMLDNGQIKASPMRFVPSGATRFGEDVTIDSGKHLQLGNGPGGQLQMQGYGGGSMGSVSVTTTAPHFLTFKAANGQNYKVPCWPA